VTESSFRIELGQRIREERTRHGYRNAKDFARVLEIDPSQLSRLEHGLRRVDTVLLRRIADELEIPLESLMPRGDVAAVAAAAAARRGDADGEQMQDMVTWALKLREDIDRVSNYVGGTTR
jgi:transcriptional regulator with XRE-family HTH domain